MSDHPNTMKWGRDQARSRYGEPKGSLGEAVGPQAPQAPEDKHGEKYDNDTGYVWQHCIAEAKPGFDKKKG